MQLNNNIESESFLLVVRKRYEAISRSDYCCLFQRFGSMFLLILAFVRQIFHLTCLEGNEGAENLVQIMNKLSASIN